MQHASGTEKRMQHFCQKILVGFRKCKNRWEGNIEIGPKERLQWALTNTYLIFKLHKWQEIFIAAKRTRQYQWKNISICLCDMNNMTKSSTNAGRMRLRDVCRCTPSKTFPFLLRVTENGLNLAVDSYLFDKWRHDCSVKSPPTGLDRCLNTTSHFQRQSSSYYIMIYSAVKLTLITL
jgi:hypothetical protein